MSKFTKRILLALVLLLFLIPIFVFAQKNLEEKNEAIFKARVIEIIEHKLTVRDDGSTLIQQKLKLRGLDNLIVNSHF